MRDSQTNSSDEEDGPVVRFRLQSWAKDWPTKEAY